MTAFYTGRAFFMTFWGPEKLPSPDDPEAPGPSQRPSHGPRTHGAGHDDPATGTAIMTSATSRRRS